MNAGWRHAIAARSLTRHSLESASLPLDAAEQPSTPAGARSDAVLAGTEAGYHNAFQDTGPGIAHAAPQGGCLALNDRFCAIAGRTREDFAAAGFSPHRAPCCRRRAGRQAPRRHASLEEG